MIKFYADGILLYLVIFQLFIKVYKSITFKLNDKKITSLKYQIRELMIGLILKHKLYLTFKSKRLPQTSTVESP